MAQVLNSPVLGNFKQNDPSFGLNDYCFILTISMDAFYLAPLPLVSVGQSATSLVTAIFIILKEFFFYMPILRVYLPD